MFFLLLTMLPLGSCSYFWFVAYPVEVQRVTYGSYFVVVHLAPTWFLSPELMFGSVHNNTKIVVSVVHRNVKLAEAILLAGEDLPTDHLPLVIRWSSGSVTITENKLGKSITFDVLGNGT